MAESQSVIRQAARVLILDEVDRVLLFRGNEVGGKRSVVWYVPGGRVEPGESVEAAAVRELWEETGLGIDLGPCVWTRRRLRSDGVDSRSSFFLVRHAGFEFDVSAVPEPGEVGEYRWWSMHEIEAAGPELFIPKRLAALLAPILAGDLPLTPIDASD